MLLGGRVSMWYHKAQSQVLNPSREIVGQSRLKSGLRALVHAVYSSVFFGGGPSDTIAINEMSCI